MLIDVPPVAPAPTLKAVVAAVAPAPTPKAVVAVGAVKGGGGGMMANWLKKAAAPAPPAVSLPTPAPIPVVAVAPIPVAAPAPIPVAAPASASAPTLAAVAVAVAASPARPARASASASAAAPFPPLSFSAEGGGGAGSSAATTASSSRARGSRDFSAISLPSEHGVIKAFPNSSNRVYSICFHPIETKLICIAGGRNGELTLWAPEEIEGGSAENAGAGAGASATNVSSSSPGKRARDEGEETSATDGEDSTTSLRELAVFAHHSEVVAAILVPAAHPASIFTASLDYSVRRLDATAGVSEVIFWDEGKPSAMALDGADNAGAAALWIGTREGALFHVDTRLPGKDLSRATGPSIQVHAEGKKITTISMGAGGTTLLTASGDATVRLWDSRKLPRVGGSMRAAEPSPLAELTHGSTVCSAYFSPRGTYIASASSDDTLRVWDSAAVAKGDLTPKATFTHDMHTGRWLVPIKAPWVSDDVFCIGSMKRAIDLIECAGKPRRGASLTSEFLTAVPTQTAAHPTLSALVGGTASGRCYLWR